MQCCVSIKRHILKYALDDLKLDKKNLLTMETHFKLHFTAWILQTFAQFQIHNIHLLLIMYIIFFISA
jgi:hypothetical protein